MRGVFSVLCWWRKGKKKVAPRVSLGCLRRGGGRRQITVFSCLAMRKRGEKLQPYRIFVFFIKRKKDIINFLRKEEYVLSKKDATIIVDAIFDYIKDVLTSSLKDPESNNVRLSIKGFGSFYTYSKPGQRKFNPHTRQYQDAPARRIVKFKRSKFLSHPQAKY